MGGFNHRLAHAFAFLENPTVGKLDAGNVPGTCAAEGVNAPPAAGVEDGSGVGVKLILGT